MAKKPLNVAVQTRTGEWRTWRELTDTERHASFEQIETMRAEVQRRIETAIEREKRQHRRAFVDQADVLLAAIANGVPDAALELATLNLNWSRQYADAIERELQTFSAWVARDMAEEIASQVGQNWTAVAQPTDDLGARGSIRAIAALAAQGANDRLNEVMRAAAVQVADGAPRSTMTANAAAVTIGRTVSAQMRQAVSQTLVKTRESVSLAQGPSAPTAVFSAVMDKWTCEACARNDGTRYKVGTPAYRRDAPPFRLCGSLTSQRGQGNECQCIYVYEFDARAGQPPRNEDGGLQIVTREAVPSPDEWSVQPGQVTLFVGLPGAGKSSLARAMAESSDVPVVVIDRDEYVLDDGGYNHAGRAESMRALAAAVRSGTNAFFVACLLTTAARASVVEWIDEMTDGQADVQCIVVHAPLDELRAVNAARAETERGSIPPDQLEHMFDAWVDVESDEPFSQVQQHSRT